LETLRYLFRRVLRNMRQSPFLCAAAIGTVAVSLALLAFFALVVVNVQDLVQRWSQDIQIVIYLDTPPPTTTLENWQREISAFSEVAQVKYVAPEEAFRRFQQRLGDEGDLLGGMAQDILPASLEISLKSEARTNLVVDEVVARLRANPNFADLRYGREWLERFSAFVGLLKAGGFLLGGFLLFATLVIVSNTIKLTLYARRDELEIMALVGGTTLFIKAPFLIEGAIQGACGGFLALGGAYFLFEFFLRAGLSQVFLLPALTELRFLPFSFQVLLIMAGVLLGFTGSLFSLRKLVRI